MNGALIWTRAAVGDLRRLHYFLAAVNDDAAIRAVRMIVSRARRILEHPGLGSPITRYGKREVRRIVVGSYEVRHVVRERDVAILRVFHHRERR